MIGTLRDFLLCGVGLRAGFTVTMSFSNKAGLIPGEGSEKSLSPPIPVCGVAVVTNDWCITYNR